MHIIKKEAHQGLKPVKAIDFYGELPLVSYKRRLGVAE